MIISNRKKKTVRLVLILAVLAALFIIGTGSAYAAGTATISSQTDLTAEAGSTVTVPVILSDNPGIAGMGLIITYDQEVLTPLAVTATELGSSGGANFNDSIETSTDNSFKIIWAVGENLTGNGTMFDVTFRVSDFAQGNTTIDISYSKPDTFNDAFEDIQLSCSPAVVNVTPKTAAVTTLRSIANQSVNAGEEIEIPIIIDNVDKVSALSFDLKFDSAVFSEASVTSGIGTCTAASSGDQLSVDATAIDTSVTSGTLCTVKLKTTDYMSGNYVFDLSSGSVATEDFQVKVVNTHADENAVVYGKNVTLDGSDLSVDVGIKNNHGIAAFRIYVNYDASKLTPVSVTKNSSLTGSFDHSIGKTEGTFDVLWFSSDNFTQNDTLFTVNFTVKDGAAGTTQISLDYSQDDTCDEHLNDVVLSMENIDVELTSAGQTDEEAAAEVTDAINVMDPEDASCVAAARAAYDALTDAQKALVDPTVLKKLTDAEDAIAQHEADQAAAAAVIDAINAMNPNDANSVAAARAAYNVLTDAQKALIDAEILKKLTDAEAAIDQQEMDQAAADNAAAVINAMDPNDASSVAAARAAYDALTDEQKALVDSAVLQKLTNAEAALPQDKIDLNTLQFVTLPWIEWDGTGYHPCVHSVELKTDDPHYLYEGVDYTVKYLNNVEVGTGTAILTGIGKYTGTVRLNFKIVPLSMTYNGGYYKLRTTKFTYDGKAKKPSLWVIEDDEYYGIPSISNSDYTIKCSTDCKSVGKHTLTYAFKGHFSGSFKKTITIVPKGTKLTKLKKGKKSMTVKWKKQSTKMAKARITGYQIRYSLKSNMKGAKKVKVKGFKKTSKKIKKLKSKKPYYVQIRTYQVVKGKTYYSSWSAKKKVKIK